MKNRSENNNNGIIICDSIVMSVRKKKTDLRLPVAVMLALCGYISVIMSFLGMFSLNYSRAALVTAVCGFSLFYIILTLTGGRALWGYAGSILVFTAAALRKRRYIREGFKFVYNIIYRKAYHTDISYYKYVEADDERKAVTILLVFGVWLLAAVIYYFTISRPNPVLPLLVTFPVIEVGLYNGIEIQVFWGMLVVAYWLSLLAMSMIDVGEYTGGTGGFVRRDDLFFPKRQMKLKVTERCGAFIVACVMLLSFASVAYLRITNYERSEKLNEKRRNITEAFDAFSFDDLPSSLARLSEAFGFTFWTDKERLGSSGSISYDNKTELVASFADVCSGAVYLKNSNSAVYKDNKWKSLSSSTYKAPVFDKFAGYGVSPQLFYGILASIIYPNRPENSLTIVPADKDDDFYAPYGVKANGLLTCTGDTLVKTSSNSEQKYDFSYMSSTEVINTVTYDPALIHPSVEYDDSNINMSDIYGGFENFLAYYEGPENSVMSLEREYRDFVYENYLQIPDNRSMDEVRKAYSSVLNSAGGDMSMTARLSVLNAIRDKMRRDSEYTLSPGKTPASRDFVNYFLLENHKGYCVHYATAGVILARMAGIPARYATGYVIVSSDFNNARRNPDGSYELEVKDNRSHAWTEIYIDGFGWVPFEFTAGYSENSIQIGGRSVEPTQTGTATTTTAAVTSAVTTTTTNGMAASQTTSARVTTLPSTMASTQPSASSDSSGGGIPKAAKYIIAVILVIAAMLAAVAIRRRLILDKREKQLNTGNSDKRIQSAYTYTMQLLRYIGISQADMNYTDFAAKVEELIGGDHIKSGSFRRLMEISLSSAFSSTPASDEDIISCIATAKALAASIYNKAGFTEKLSLKYFKALY